MTEQILTKWTLERWLLLLTFSASTFTMIFGVGVNYERLSRAGLRVTALEMTCVPRELYASDQRALRESNDRLDERLQIIYNQHLRMLKDDHQP